MGVDPSLSRGVDRSVPLAEGCALCVGVVNLSPEGKVPNLEVVLRGQVTV